MLRNIPPQRTLKRDSVTRSDHVITPFSKKREIVRKKESRDRPVGGRAFNNLLNVERERKKNILRSC